MSESVRAWAETVLIPTYGTGAPEKNPLFLEKRVYQGSSGAVYPHPVIEQVSDSREDRPYTAVFLQNRYLKIMILPELGGRVQMAQDTTNGFHFIYYNRVIKPALVGLAGPWISGGIEFNWPQHHRPSTFMPLDWAIREHADGSATVYCAEVEAMFGTRGAHSFTLHPDLAALQIDVQLYNRTTTPQTFLWWANPAVHVNDDYQSVFPPDVHAVMDHGKRDVSTFPIATGTYYKVDYRPGTDISRYRNIPVPTSYMAYHSDFDFVGSYDHGAQAGMLHVANHHLVPGKKQWTWGNGDFGKAWDRQLTDADGPYIELMCGAFTDNQPDFSWLMPGEEKRFTQYFLPYKQIGPATNASQDVVIHFDVVQLAPPPLAPPPHGGRGVDLPPPAPGEGAGGRGGEGRIGVYLTRPRTVEVELRRGADLIWSERAALSPEAALTRTVDLPAGTRPQELTLRAVDAASGRELLAFSPPPAERAPTPEPARPAPRPSEIASNEELFLNGLHLEQYRHATRAPEPYYEEAIRRDPHDSRCHNALGRLRYRRGDFAAAERHFRAAVASLTRRNPNPYDGEPHYNLGLALMMQGRDREAVDAFYKATWSAAWQDSGFFELARAAGRAGDLEQALELARRALGRNAAHQQARHLMAALLRRLGRRDEARAEVERALRADPLDAGMRVERRMLDAADPAARLLDIGDSRLALEIAIDYMHAGLLDEATALILDAPAPDPLAIYTLALCRQRAGDAGGRMAALARAAAMPPDYCFPQRLESVPALEAAIDAGPDDARAPYYLGLFLYAHRRHAEAIARWEQAATRDPSFATVWRNLGLAAVNTQGDMARGLTCYERAFALNPDDARVLFELDQLARRMGQSPAERLDRLRALRALVDRRDDLTIEYVALLNSLGRPAEALEMLMGRRFHPWEGGEGKVAGQYVLSLTQMARARLDAGDPAGAAALLRRALSYPPNIGEGKLPNAQENNIRYFLGLALEQLGDAPGAREQLALAAQGLSEPTSAMFYNDQPPDMIFYQGLAQRKLGQESAAQATFRRLVNYGFSHYDDTVEIDYFAVSLPSFLVFDEDLGRSNRIHCRYMVALGNLGLGVSAAARSAFDDVLALDPNHQGAIVHRMFNVEL